MKALRISILAGVLAAALVVALVACAVAPMPPAGSVPQPYPTPVQQ